MSFHPHDFVLLKNSDSPYPSRPTSLTFSNDFVLPVDIALWGSNISDDVVETDDELHDPDEKQRWVTPVSRRGLSNLGCLLSLIAGILGLFIGLPIALHILAPPSSTLGAFNLGGINGTGQIPEIPGNRGLIDVDTPQSAYTTPSWAADGTELQLVFSDEFNTDGRTFYPGDDPYWEAVDLHYWQTNDLEWYDPEAITTEDGALVITLSQKEIHNLNYESGMLTSWNKFCFTGGYFEVAVQLPGNNDIVGLWPAIWAMGNLGRAGYGATLQGLWPYTYDTCDVGTVANQTVNGLPAAATTGGDPTEDGVLSFLPGQRLSRCTCPGESHPGPKHSDGTFVGRAAPEIDVFEAQIDTAQGIGQVSQSAQWAPFDQGYEWQNTSANFMISNPSLSALNTFVGSATQEATSVVTTTDQSCYENNGGCFSVYGFEYVPGFDSGYIAWISNNQLAWTLQAGGMGPNSVVQIGARPVPQEPMYLIMNLGMSLSFSQVDLTALPFPVHMRVDYVRVYQPPNAINIGCDPANFPTEAYINQYMEAYTNPNLTTWNDDFGQPVPKNSFLGQC
ncbi:glycoside hydrolase family 16 protein [Pluteus cervinus]|uniref:Glycoside hydrolase family 16 protein n=1 Tax=Pluteus cervinus TaxID=181527 RepID=A0ACD3BCJ3_9AGAR|nr:glycoside hydrolase family 16 protein [Pluteus cervinus]